MSVFSGNLSEHQLFRLAVEQPRVLDSQLSQLNLTFVNDGLPGNEGKNLASQITEAADEPTLEVK